MSYEIPEGCMHFGPEQIREEYTQVEGEEKPRFFIVYENGELTFSTHQPSQDLMTINELIDREVTVHRICTGLSGSGFISLCQNFPYDVDKFDEMVLRPEVYAFMHGGQNRG